MLNIEIYCSEHSEVFLDGNLDRKGNLHVIPCKKCLEEARDEGYTDGIKEGQDQY